MLAIFTGLNQHIGYRDVLLNGFSWKLILSVESSSFKGNIATHYSSLSSFEIFMKFNTRKHPSGH